jgi:putative transposase
MKMIGTSLGGIVNLTEMLAVFGHEQRRRPLSQTPFPNRDHQPRRMALPGDVIDTLVQRRRNAHAAKRFFCKLMKGQGSEPRWLITDRLRSYGAAHRAVMPSVEHVTARYANNRAEVSHQPTRQRERQMRRFKSAGQAQRFLAVQGVVLNLFRLGRHRLRAPNYRLLRARSQTAWQEATAP